MAKRPTNLQLDAMLAELREALDALSDGAVIDLYDDAGRRIGTRKTPNVGRLLTLLSAARLDGYGTRSGGGGGGSLTGDHSDRVGRIAADDVKIHDPVRFHGERVLRALTHALGDLRVARGSMIAAFEDVKPGSGDPACVAHASAGLFEALGDAGRNGRCNWCYRFWLAHGVTPPAEIVRLHAEGRRITPAMLTAAFRGGSRVTRGRRASA